MIEAAMIWNEPNNKSHWDFESDPGWGVFARMARLVGRGGRGGSAGSPARARRHFADRPRFHCALWPRMGVFSTISMRLPCMVSRSTGTIGKLRNGRRRSKRNGSVTHLPVWVSEVGVSTFGAEEVQEWGLRRTAELLTRPRAPASDRVQPLRSSGRLARDDAAQGRLKARPITAISIWEFLDEHGSPKRAARIPRNSTPESGSASGFILRITDLTTPSDG